MFGRLGDHGHTPAEIRAMTLTDFERLCRYWKSHPPVRDLLHALAVWAAAVKPPSSPKSSANRPSMAELKSLMGEK